MIWGSPTSRDLQRWCWLGEAELPRVSERCLHQNCPRSPRGGQPLWQGVLRSPDHFEKNKRTKIRNKKPPQNQTWGTAFLKMLFGFVAVWAAWACGVTSQFSGAVLHISNKGRFLEEDGAVLEMDNPFSKVIFKYRVIAVLHDKMHVPLCLIFELVRPFFKGHHALI